MVKVKQSRFGCLNRLSSICVVFMSLFHAVVGDSCFFYTDPCICQTSSFEVNLKPLMDAMGGADFTATVIDGLFTYHYYVQPCNRRLSSQIAACIDLDPDLVSCQQLTSSTLAYGLGLIGGFEATQIKDGYVLTNSYQGFFGDYTIRKLELTIKCSDQDASFTYQGYSSTSSPITYRFTLLTKYICSGGWSGNVNVEVGLSAGSIMVIVFFVVIVVYLAGGLLFQKFVRKAEGTDMIPNVSFWIAIPLLAKDGVMFLIRGCKGGATQENK